MVCGQRCRLAPGWYFLETAPGVSSIVLGMPSVVGGVSSATELGDESLTPYQRLAYSVLLAAEMRLHVNRVVQCAMENDVDLDYQFEAIVTASTTATVETNGTDGAAQTVNGTRVLYQDQSRFFRKGLDSGCIEYRNFFIADPEASTSPIDRASVTCLLLRTYSTLWGLQHLVWSSMPVPAQCLSCCRCTTA